MSTRPRVAFVNGGILGLLSYAEWLRRAFPASSEIDPTHIVLSEQLSGQERFIRRLLCQRLWPDPRGLANLDLARYRQEWHAGLQARRRLRALGEDRFDVLHFHRQATAYASLDLMRRVPSIVTMDCTQTCAMQAMESSIERASLAPNIRRDGEVFRHAAAIVAISRWAADDLVRRYPDCAPRVMVMADPVRLEAFDTAWASERSRRARRPRFLFVGGDFPRKGGYDLLAAWTAGEFHLRAELVLVTNWPLGALPPGVSQRTGIAGYSPAWLEEWRDADVFVMPTRNEAYGLVYLEAAAAGLPAIGTRINAVPEIVIDGETGRLVEPGDVAGLVRAMEDLLRDRSQRFTYGTAARHHVDRLADPAAHRAALLELIQRLASSPLSGSHV